MASCLRLVAQCVSLRTQCALMRASSHMRALALPALQPVRLTDNVLYGTGAHRSISAGAGRGSNGFTDVQRGTRPRQHARNSAPNVACDPPVVHQRRQQRKAARPQPQQQQQQQEGEPAAVKKEKRPERVLDGAAVAALEAEYEQALRTACVTEGQRLQLERYLDFLLDTNKVMNLTAVRDRSEALVRHLADSLSLLPVIEHHMRTTATCEVQHTEDSTATAGAALKVIDVGTGAGLPGMVLAIVRPHWQISLLDSLRKRCDFLGRAAEVTGVSNVSVVWCRAEEGGQRADLRGTFDLAVARAVAETRVLSELCLPFVRAGGVWIAAKGPDPKEEVEAASRSFQLLGGRLVSVEPVTSSSEEGPRTAVVIHKQAATPKKYPRAPGTPNKSPL